MRITQGNLFDQVRRHVQANTADLMKAQQRLATQHRFDRLSEQPVQGGRLLDLGAAQARAQQYVRNIDRMNALAGIQDATLGQVGELIARAKELLLQESNEATSTASTREAARIEIAHLISQLVQAANTRFDGQYIFAGFAVDAPAFSDAAVQVDASGVAGGIAARAEVADFAQLNYHDYVVTFTAPDRFSVTDVATGAVILSDRPYTSGSTVIIQGIALTISDETGPPVAGDTLRLTTQPPGMYRGDGQTQHVEIQPGTRVAQNIPGDRAFGGVGVPGGVDVFAVLNEINRALAANDRDSMRTQLARLDAAQTQLANERSAVGARVNLLESARTRHQDLIDSLQTIRSDLQDIDLAEAITELTRRQNAYEAALGAAAQVVQPSLLDFLR